jgi:hypothetical protein
MGVANGVARRRAGRVHLTHKTVVQEVRHGSRWKLPLGLALVGLLVGLVLYAPALTGELVLDDLVLPLAAGDQPHPLAGWHSEVRPVLMLSYRLNGMLLGVDASAYHIVNLLIHVANTCLVFLALRALLRRADWLDARARFAAVGAALVFLVHPLQTESVSYIAGRSESLASFFMLFAYVVFLYDRRGGISWRRALAVMVLFAIAVKTKENAVSLAGVLLLTDVMCSRAFSLDGPQPELAPLCRCSPERAAGGDRRLRTLATAAVFRWRTTRRYSTRSPRRAIFAYLQLAIVPLGRRSTTISRRRADPGAAARRRTILALAGRWRPRFGGASLSARVASVLMFLVWLRRRRHSCRSTTRWWSAGCTSRCSASIGLPARVFAMKPSVRPPSP